MKKKSFKKKIIKILQFLFNPRFLLCFGLGWMVTNGWAYVLLFIGTFLKIGWMIGVASGYLALLWIPFTPEKIITIIIAMGLLRVLFPNDKKTLGILRTLYKNVKINGMKRKKEKNAKKVQEDSEKAMEK